MTEIITDMTPIQYQAGQVSERLARVMEKVHLLTQEVLSLIELANVLAEIDSNNVDRKDGQWRKVDE